MIDSFPVQECIHKQQTNFHTLNAIFIISSSKWKVEHFKKRISTYIRDNSQDSCISCLLCMGARAISFASNFFWKIYQETALLYHWGYLLWYILIYIGRKLWKAAICQLSKYKLHSYECCSSRYVEKS